MSIDQEKDPREELYNRFKEQQMSHTGDTPFYDRDDLLDIYTYADDEGDFYTMIESIDVGLRLYPDDEEFKLRRAMTLDELGFHEQAVSLARSVVSVETYPRLVNLRLNLDVEPAAVEYDLESIIEDATSLDEDEIILITEIVKLKMMDKWLEAHIDTIREKSEYLPTLYYELALNSSENEDYESALDMAEKLVDIEPMKSDFWEFYAEIAYNVGDMGKVVIGCDYALAIDSDSNRAKVLKGCAILEDKESQPQWREGAKLLEEVLEKDLKVLQPQAIFALSRYYANNDDMNNVIRVITRFLDNTDEMPFELVSVLMITDYQAGNDYFNRFIKSQINQGTDYFLDLAARFQMTGNDKLAGALLAHYDNYTPELSKTYAFFDIMYGSLYTGALYESVIAKYENGINNFAAFTISPVKSMAYIMSMLRARGPEAALKVAQEIADDKSTMRVVGMTTPLYSIRQQSIKVFAQTVVDRLTAANCQVSREEIDGLDPFISHTQAVISAL